MCSTPPRLRAPKTLALTRAPAPQRRDREDTWTTEPTRGSAAAAGEKQRGPCCSPYTMLQTGFTPVGNDARDKVNIKKQVTETGREENRKRSSDTSWPSWPSPAPPWALWSHAAVASVRPTRAPRRALRSRRAAPSARQGTKETIPRAENKQNASFLFPSETHKEGACGPRTSE